MKLSRFLIVIVTVVLVCSLFSGYMINEKYRRKLLDFNACYDLIEHCRINGVDKEKLKENEKLLQRISGYSVTERYYKNSKFNNITISFSNESYDYSSNDISSNTDHCSDLKEAVFLAFLLNNDPEELINKFQNNLKFNSEFMFLVTEKYTLTPKEKDIITQAVISFTENEYAEDSEKQKAQEFLDILK